jgi:hypothetical protein
MFLHRNDVVDLEELFVGARLDPAARVAGLERPPMLRRDGALGRGDGIDVVAVAHEHSHRGVEHASPSGRDTDRGSRPSYEHMFVCQAPLLNPSTTRAQRSRSLLYGA